jgi:Flp pilus assembly pilin Flp
VNFLYLLVNNGGTTGLTFPSSRVEVRLPPAQKAFHHFRKGQSFSMLELLRNCWSDDQGQDIAEYAVMLAVILVIVVGTIRLIGTQANNVFSQTASAMGG